MTGRCRSGRGCGGSRGGWRWRGGGGGGGGGRGAGRAGKRGLACDPAVLEALEGEFRRFERGPADSFRQRVDRLAGCVEKLPPLMRGAVEMVYRRGLTLAGIAGAVDATEEAVKKRVQRGRQLLARCLETGGAG